MVVVALGEGDVGLGAAGVDGTAVSLQVSAIRLAGSGAM
jgi:hypothetical protein